MNTFGKRIGPAVAEELRAAREAEAAGRIEAGFRHLERAHVLGQASTLLHVRAHVHMLSWGLRQRDLREAWGQVVRIIGAATKTALGWVPAGNTGGANVSPFKPLPISADLQQILRDARTDTNR